jgi:hypothetical protein
MKKLIILGFFTLSLIFCGGNNAVVDRTEENNVEIIKNHIEPYELNKLNNFTIRVLFFIDTSSTLITKTGLMDIQDIDVDSEGNIYCISRKNREYLIFKFDKNGKFIDPIIKKGRGPGEIDNYSNFQINSKDEIEIYQARPPKLKFFNEKGELIREKFLETSYIKAFTLKNGNYLALGPHNLIDTLDENSIHAPLRILNSNLEKIKDLEIRKWPNLMGTNKLKYSEHVFQWRISRKNIFIANENRDYEILVYDLDGHPMRKIQKEYKRVNIPPEIKDRFKKASRYADRISFPKHFCPFQGIFTDDKGKLFVATYEKGENPGEYIHDIYNDSGVFIGRKSLNHSGKTGYGAPFALSAILKNNHLYCLQEDDIGYKKIAVYKVNWE